MTGTDLDDACVSALGSPNAGERYPEHLMPIAGSLHQGPPNSSPLATRYDLFSALREEVLVDYCYNTARAYWGDLEDLFWWAESRGKDIHRLSDPEFNEYRALLRRRKYSENTVRRRRTAYRKLRLATEQTFFQKRAHD